MNLTVVNKEAKLIAVPEVESVQIFSCSFDENVCYIVIEDEIENHNREQN